VARSGGDFASGVSPIAAPAPAAPPGAAGVLGKDVAKAAKSGDGRAVEPSSDADRFGLLGLLGAIRTTDPDLDLDVLAHFGKNSPCTPFQKPFAKAVKAGRPQSAGGLLAAPGGSPLQHMYNAYCTPHPRQPPAPGASRQCSCQAVSDKASSSNPKPAPRPERLRNLRASAVRTASAAASCQTRQLSELLPDLPARAQNIAPAGGARRFFATQQGARGMVHAIEGGDTITKQSFFFL
jgi:hypothetical protein